MKTDRYPNFNWGYIAAQEDMCGKMSPFRPMWWAQYLGDGTQEWFDTRSECIAWMRDW